MSRSPPFSFRGWLATDASIAPRRHNAGHRCLQLQRAASGLCHGVPARTTRRARTCGTPEALRIDDQMIVPGYRGSWPLSALTILPVRVELRRTRVGGRCCGLPRRRARSAGWRSRPGRESRPRQSARYLAGGPHARDNGRGRGRRSARTAEATGRRDQRAPQLLRPPTTGNSASSAWCWPGCWWPGSSPLPLVPLEQTDDRGAAVIQRRPARSVAGRGEDWFCGIWASEPRRVT